MNRSRGGWAGLPRQAELISLIPATLQAAGTSVSWTWPARPAGAPALGGWAGTAPGTHPQGRGGSGRGAPLSLQVMELVRGNSRFCSLLCFILNISSLVTGLRLLHSGLLLL